MLLDRLEDPERGGIRVVVEHVGTSPHQSQCRLPPGGSIKHGEVVLAWPGKFLRLQAALGPLQDLGVAAALTYTLEPAGEGKTKVTQSYKAGGLDAATLEGAPLFDHVVGGSLTRFKTYVETGKPG